MAETSFGIGIYADTRDARQDIDALNQRLRGIEQNTGRTQRSLGRLERGARIAARALAGVVTAEVLRRSVVLADQYTTLAIRVGQIVDASTDAERALNQLVRTAGVVGITTASAIDTFQRFTFAREALGATDDQLLAFNATVAQLGALSGASTQALSAGLLQLGQALTQPIVRMEEFNSLTENLPALVNELAIGLGVSSDELIRLARSEQLLSRDVFEALLARGADVNELFEELPDTSERALQDLKNVVQRELGEAFDTEPVAEFIRSITRGIDVIPEAFNLIGASILEFRQDFNNTLNEFFLVDVPSYIQEGFAGGIRDASILWIEFVEGLREALAEGVPLLADAIDFNPNDQVRKIQEVEEQYRRTAAAIEAEFDPIRAQFAALGDEAAANTQRALVDFLAAIAGAAGTGLSDIIDVDTEIDPPRISGRALQQARDEFFDVFGTPAQQIQIEWDEANVAVQEAVDKFIITNEEATAVLERLSQERARALVDADIAAWEDRVDAAIQGQQTLNEIQQGEVLAEFGTPIEQLQQQFAERQTLLQAFLDTGVITYEEFAERLRQLDEERVIAAADVEDRLWNERFDRARRGLTEYERTVQNLADIDDENANIREEAMREVWDTMIDITRSGSDEIARIGKALAIAQIVRDGVVAVQKAWASAPFPANLPAVALVSAQTLANVARVRGGRAFGGTVLEDAAYNVGELGGELFRGRSGSQIFIPPERGTVTPLEAGNVNIQVNLINAPENTRVDQRRDDSGLQVIDIIIEQTENRLAGRLALGDGPVPKAIENTYGLTRRGG